MCWMNWGYVEWLLLAIHKILPLPFIGDVLDKRSSVIPLKLLSPSLCWLLNFLYVVSQSKTEETFPSEGNHFDTKKIPFHIFWACTLRNYFEHFESKHLCICLLWTKRDGCTEKGPTFIFFASIKHTAYISHYRSLVYNSHIITEAWLSFPASHVV